MKFTDNIGLWGLFNMKVYDVSTGEKKLVRQFTKNNQIVNDGRQALLELMAPSVGGLNQVERQLGSISAGTNATPPTIVNTGASMVQVWKHAFTAGEIIRVNVAPNSFYVWIQATMLTTDAVGSVLAEAGVFTRGDDPDPTLSTTRKLYARQTHPLINPKTATMVIAYDWRFGVSIQ